MRSPGRSSSMPRATRLGVRFKWIVDPALGKNCMLLRLPPNHRAAPHWHTSDTVYLVTDGEFTSRARAASFPARSAGSAAASPTAPRVPARRAASSTSSASGPTASTIRTSIRPRSGVGTTTPERRRAWRPFPVAHNAGGPSRRGGPCGRVDRGNAGRTARSRSGRRAPTHRTAVPPGPCGGSLAAASLGAAVLHFGYSPSHFDQYWVYGAFLVAVAWLQVASAVGCSSRPTRAVLFGTIVLDAVVVSGLGVVAHRRRRDWVPTRARPGPSATPTCSRRRSKR